MAAAASALGWSSVEAYKKNLRAEGKPVGCAVPTSAPAARPPQMRAPGGAKLAAGPPHPVQQHSDNIIKWMFGDLFDDHASHSLHPTALHLAGKQFKAKEAPKPAAPVVLRADGSRVHRTAAEKMYDREQHELRVEEREERRYRQERQEHAVRGDERRSEMELEEAKFQRVRSERGRDISHAFHVVHLVGAVREPETLRPPPDSPLALRWALAREARVKRVGVRDPCCAGFSA